MPRNIPLAFSLCFWRAQITSGSSVVSAGPRGMNTSTPSPNSQQFRLWFSPAPATWLRLIASGRWSSNKFENDWQSSKGHGSTFALTEHFALAKWVYPLEATCESTWDWAHTSGPTTGKDLAGVFTFWDAGIAQTEDASPWGNEASRVQQCGRMICFIKTRQIFPLSPGFCCLNVILPSSERCTPDAVTKAAMCRGKWSVSSIKKLLCRGEWPVFLLFF